MSMPTLRIGTRSSALAQAQAHLVADAIRQLDTGLDLELVSVSTPADLRPTSPIDALGRGAFVRELERALLEREIDVAVHSLKDLPTVPTAGLVLAAVPARADPRDALVSRTGGLDELPRGALVGTSSPRRQAQLRHLRPGLTMMPLRGNVDTRLRKLDDGQYDAIVIAVAGLQRLGLTSRITQRLDPSLMLPAPGQGALAIQARQSDPRVERLRRLDDPATRAAVEAERAFMRRLEAGCLVPAAALATLEAGVLVLDGLLTDPEGRSMFRLTVRGSPFEAQRLGVELAEEILELGGARLLERAETGAP
jgi:hydroxymethylbilane synthase